MCRKVVGSDVRTAGRRSPGLRQSTSEDRRPFVNDGRNVPHPATVRRGHSGCCTSRPYSPANPLLLTYSLRVRRGLLVAVVLVLVDLLLTSVGVRRRSSAWLLRWLLQDLRRGRVVPATSQ
jgi:hypothetical protein